MRTSRADPRVPDPSGFAGVRLDARSRRALGALGAALRRDEPTGWATAFRRGEPISARRLGEQLPTGAVDDLVGAGLARVEGPLVNLLVTVIEVGGVLTAIPKVTWGPEVVYLGPDSAHLAEAALRLAPRGDRAADLGTGTGLLAALLARRFRTVVATDLVPSVVLAAEVTFALNPRPAGHVLGACATDVAGGLRPGAFDLVVANAPWVPLDVRADAPRELFAHGGDTGFELPDRFLVDGATLLRPGGLAITLALDVELRDGTTTRAPLRERCADLTGAGYRCAVLATPFNRERPGLLPAMQTRQPRLVAATHVAVLVGRPRSAADDQAARFVAVEALGRRWSRDAAIAGRRSVAAR